MQHPQLLAAVVARLMRPAEVLEILLAFIFPLLENLLVRETHSTYEELHRQHLAAVVGQRLLQQLEEEERVLLRAGAEEQRRQQPVEEAPPLCSLLRRRRQQEEVAEGLQPGAVAGLPLLLVGVVVVHLRRRQEVCKGQSC